MVWGVILGAAASFLASAYQSNRAAKEGAIGRDWMSRQSDTAHQREVIDLRAAGLNPILSGTGGMGASTGSPPIAQYGTPDIAGGASSGMDVTRRFQEVKNLKQQNKNLSVEEDILRNEERKRHWEASIAKQNVHTAYNTARISEVEGRERELNNERYIAEFHLFKRALQGKFDQADLESHPAYKAKRWFDAGTESAKGVSSAVRDLLPWGGWGSKTPKGSSARSQSRGR